MNILIITDVDSRKKWANIVVNYFTNYTLTYFDNFINIKIINEFYVIILALGGGANYKFLLKFSQYIEENKPKRRPIIITGFNGSTDTDNIHALLCRVGSDFICLNSKKDYNNFSNHLKKLNFSNHTLTLTGLAKQYNQIEKVEKNKIVFFAQPDVPKTKRERVYIVKKLEQLALKYPDKLVYIKPRSKKGSSNITHQEKYYYQDLLKENSIKNIYLIYDDVEKILLSTNLSITVGSTVALESIHCKVNTVVLSDFGIRQEYGNHHFMGSGCLLSFDDLLSAKKGYVNQVWKENNILIDSKKFENLVTKVLKKIEQQKNTHEILPLEPLYYNKNNASYFYYNTLRINDCNKNIWFRFRNLPIFKLN